MEADGIWQAWENDDEAPAFGQGFATLRDAKAECVASYSDDLATPPAADLATPPAADS